MGEVTKGEIALLDQKIEDRLLKGILTYEKLLEVVVDQILPDHFSTKTKANLFHAISWYWKEYGKIPIQDSLEILIEELFPSGARACTRMLERILELPEPQYEWLVANVDQYLKKIRLQKALYDAAGHLNENRYASAEDLLVRAIASTGVISSSAVNDLELSKSELFQLSQDHAEFVFPSRVWALDDIIRGFYRKELAIFMAPLNVGKSWAMIHLAVSALMGGHRVLYFTLEMSKQRVLQRLIQNISGTVRPFSDQEYEREIRTWTREGEQDPTDAPLHVRTLLDANKTSRHLEQLRKLEGSLWVQEYPSGEATVKDLEKDILKFDLRFGRLPDVILVDGIMDLEFAGSGDSRNMRFGLGDITKALRKFAVNYNCSVIATHQANRQAIEAEMVGTQHAGESLRIMQVADIAITLNQTSAERALRKMRLHVARSRNTNKGETVALWQNLDIASFHQYSEIVDESYEEAEKPSKLENRWKKRASEE